MRIPKVYGQSKSNHCPFCNKRAITQSEQGIPVCASHKSAALGDCKCMCGDYLDIRKGRFGPYFNCMNCGNLNFNKGLELNPDAAKITHHQEQSKPVESAQKPPIKQFTPTETVVRSDELDFL